jgi:integrase
MTLTLTSTHANLPGCGGYLSARELADLWHVTPRTVSKKAREGRITAVKIFGDWRFNPLELGVDMGRKGRTGAGGIIQKKGSPFYYILSHGKATSTKTSDLKLAQAMLYEMKAKALRGMVEGEGAGSRIMPGTAITGSSSSDTFVGSSTTPSFKSILTRYLAEISPSKSRSGASDFTNSRMLLLFFGEDPIDKIVPHRAYQYREWRRHMVSNRTHRPISNGTINREIALVKTILKTAVFAWGYIDRSPLPKGEVEGLGERKRERYITDEEFKVICDALQGQKALIIQTLYYTTQRCNRILFLLWRQINLMSRTISFERVSQNKGVPDIVYINNSLLAVLRGLQEERKQRQVISPYVFTNRNGAPFTSIKTAWKTACKKAGVQDARIHDIRHKAITDGIREGVPISIAKKAVGHAQIATTDGYTHIQPEDVRPFFEALDRHMKIGGV